MTFLQKLSTSRPELLYIVRGEDAGKHCWHYILVDKMKVEAFKKDLKAAGIYLSQYGKILVSGWGENPPEDIDTKIKAEYS